MCSASLTLLRLDYNFNLLTLNSFINLIHTHQVLSLVHLPSPIYSAAAFYLACSVFCTLVQLKKALLGPKRFAFW